MMADQATAQALAELTAAFRRASRQLTTNSKAAHDALREQVIHARASIATGSAAELAEFRTKLSRGDIVGAMVVARELAIASSVTATNVANNIGEPLAPAPTVYATRMVEVRSNQGHTRPH